MSRLILKQELRQNLLHPSLWAIFFGVITIIALYKVLTLPSLYTNGNRPEMLIQEIAKELQAEAQDIRQANDILSFQALERFEAHDIDLLARTIYGEARGEISDIAREAVAHVVLNRVRDKYSRWPKTIAEVVLQKNQFSCWNNNDPNYTLIKNATFRDPHFKKAYKIALKAIHSGDKIRGANHFHTHTVAPAWAQNNKTVQKITKIDSHIFYKI